MIWKWKQSALIGGRHCRLAFNTFNCISKYLLFVLIFDHILSNSFIFYFILLCFQQCMQGGAGHCRLVGKEEWTTVDWSQLQGGESIWKNNSPPGRKKWGSKYLLGWKIEELVDGRVEQPNIQKCVLRLNWRGLLKRKSPLLWDSSPTWKALGLRRSSSERSSYNFLKISNIINIINKLFSEVVLKLSPDHHH